MHGALPTGQALHFTGDNEEPLGCMSRSETISDQVEGLPRDTTGDSSKTRQHMESVLDPAHRVGMRNGSSKRASQTPDFDFDRPGAKKRKVLEFATRVMAQNEKQTLDEPRFDDPNFVAAYSYFDELVQKLTTQNSELRSRVKELEDSLSLTQDSPEPQVKLGPWLILHRVTCPESKAISTFPEEPTWTVDQLGHCHLDARHRIMDEPSFEATQGKAGASAFVEYREYHCYHSSPKFSEHAHQTDGPLSFHTPFKFAPNHSIHDPVNVVGLEIKILSENLHTAVKQMFDSAAGLQCFRPEKFESTGRLRAPFVMHHHFGKEMIAFGNRLAGFCREDYDILINFIGTYSSETEQRVNRLLHSGLVDWKSMPYLFRPGELLLKRNESHFTVVEQIDKIAWQKQDEVWRCKLRKLHWVGDYVYSEAESDLDIPKRNGQTVRLHDLTHYPLSHATNATRAELLGRGTFLYRCRNGLYVEGPDEDSGNLIRTRYMVDVKVYCQFFGVPKIKDKIELAVNNHGSEKFLLMLPALTTAYNVQTKRWKTVPVAGLTDVRWDERAFENLAVDDDTKELVQALVTEKIDADRSTDVVAGKGNGLILLLHGGPGTGKTLTAETVAEIAKKPLYRVSCGDIGTTAKAVEEHLGNIFRISHVWGCVVLLDEAEVFLEKRSFADLERNALVSVFLRVLEYHSGILMLTSNRVGTFDEAFKSRIQLALHYGSLDESQRKKIWDNFIKRLENLDEDIDIDNIRDNLKDLTKHRMNGREIRNCVTTARQLAKFNGQPLNYKHLQRVIRVSRKFEDYLREVTEGEAELVRGQGHGEEMAREEGIR